MPSGDANLSRKVSLAATALTALVVVLPPSIYFALSYQHTAGVLDAEAEINARIVSRVVSANPELWQYEQARFAEYLSRRPTTGDAERRRIVDARGAIVAESADPLPGPRITRSVRLFDAGVPVGRIEVCRSLRPLVFRSGVLAAGLLALALLSFRALRTAPLRAIQRAQDALRRERDTAQRYLDCAGVAFVIVDEARRVRLVNRKGCEILGRTEEEVLGREFTEFVDPPDRARFEDARAASARPDEVGVQYAVVRPDGARRLVSWYVAPIEDDEHRRTGVLASGVDVTREAELEERLRKAQRLEAIGRLAGGVAHDFNNVLSVIKVKAEVLRRQMEPDSPRRRQVEDIMRSADRAALLTRDLLTFGRQRVLNTKPVDAVELLRGAEAPLRDLLPDTVELELALPGNPLPVLADPVELERVLMNLVTNARDAMPTGGRIVISAARAQLDAAAADASSLQRPGEYATVSVADTGTGIPAEAQASLFEPFFTTKPAGKGTGLGLSIAYAIVKQHGGAIRVASAPGKGTTFTLLLPIRADAPPEAAAG